MICESCGKEKSFLFYGICGDCGKEKHSHDKRTLNEIENEPTDLEYLDGSGV